MKEIADIIQAYDTLGTEAHSMALALVIEIKGSSYRRTGARMLIQENGFWTGGISGGCIEGNALKKANLAILEQKSRVVTYDTENDDESQIGVSLGCNGIITVLISPIDRGDKQNQIEHLRSINENRDPAVIITIVESQVPSLIPGEVLTVKDFSSKNLHLSKDLQSSINYDIDKVFARKKSALVDYSNEVKLFIEFIPPSIQLIIAGGNYDVLPLLLLSKNLGWSNIVVNNPRRLSTTLKNFSETILEDLDDAKTDPYTVLMIMSHDYNADLNNLAKAIKKDLLYIGLLGPASRKNDMFSELGITANDLQNRVFGPAGLDIGAQQPEEIAIAVLAEIIAVIRERPGSSLRLRTSPINDRN